MPIPSNLNALNQVDQIELVLDLNSFAGGENTIGEDVALKNNEARLIENWDALSLGGMERSKGFNLIATGGGSYTDAPDLLVHHKQLTATQIYGIIEGDLVKLDGADLDLEDNAAFTSGLLCSAVSAGDKLWITNATDNLKVKTNGVAIAANAGLPTVARERIYHAKFRLFAEGGGRTIYGSRAGTGNWSGADAFSLANDAFNIDLPDDTKGMAVNFPSGSEDAVFTYFSVYALYNYPDVAYRPIANGRGCCAPMSIARGDEGVYFLSNYPSLGVFLWNGVDFIELTENHDFVNDIDLSKRIFGEYRNNQYYIFYCETGSGVSYPNRLKIYDATLGRWMTRPINTTLDDNFGYPCLLKYDNNELYVSSSRKDSIYELETEDNSDETYNTEANYKTKDFSSVDFNLANNAGRFPIDNVRIKLVKMIITFFGTAGTIGVQWTADYGLHSGSQTIDLATTEGDLINDTFIVNTSEIITLPNDRIKILSFNNSAVGRKFNFQITNSGSGTRPKIKSLKILALAYEEA